MLQRSIDQVDSPERTQQPTSMKQWGATSGLVTSPFSSPVNVSNIATSPFMSPETLSTATPPEASTPKMELTTPSTATIEADAGARLEAADIIENSVEKAPDSDPDALTAGASESDSSNYVGEGEAVELEAAEPVDEDPTAEDGASEDEREVNAVSSPAKPAASFPLGPIQCHNIDVEEMRAVAAQLLPAIARAVIEQVGGPKGTQDLQEKLILIGFFAMGIPFRCCPSS